MAEVEAQAEVAWVGTGTTYGGPARLTDVRVGTRYDKRTMRVIDNSRTFTAPSKLTVSCKTPKVADGKNRLRFCLLEPSGSESIGDALKMGTNDTMQTTWGPGTWTPGVYIFVLEMNDQPLVVEQVTVN